MSRPIPRDAIFQLCRAQQRVIVIVSIVVSGVGRSPLDPRTRWFTWVFCEYNNSRHNTPYFHSFVIIGAAIVTPLCIQSICSSFGTVLIGFWKCKYFGRSISLWCTLINENRVVKYSCIKRYKIRNVNNSQYCILSDLQYNLYTQVCLSTWICFYTVYIIFLVRKNLNVLL